MATLEEVLEANLTSAHNVDEEALTAYYNNDSIFWVGEEADNVIRACEDAYQGHYANGTDYAEELMADLYDIPNHLYPYIDYAAFWRDLCMGDGYWEEDGHVFSA